MELFYCLGYSHEDAMVIAACIFRIEFTPFTALTHGIESTVFLNGQWVHLPFQLILEAFYHIPSLLN